MLSYRKKKLIKITISQVNLSLSLLLFIYLAYYNKENIFSNLCDFNIISCYIKMFMFIVKNINIFDLPPSFY